MYLILAACHSNTESTTKQSPKQADTSLVGFFKLKNWQYPIEIDTSAISYPKDLAANKPFSTVSLIRLLLKWYRSDSTFKHYGPAAIVVSEMNIYQHSNLSYELSCRVDFYSKGEMINGVVIPVEGHGIVENKFLRQRETAIFSIVKDTLFFRNWANL
jgi:hypothetical protein